MIAQAETPADPNWAWAIYEPSHQRPWNLASAAHLYRRAAFGGNWAEFQQALSDGPQRTIDRLLRPQTDVDAFNRAYDEQESIGAGSVDGLRAWWLRRMIETPHPLLEKMMLFWHGHFATNARGVKDPRLMQQHARLLRSHALGPFSDLLQAISCDPAMLTWLGADANRKAAPSEGFVRPLLETFTLGSGGFTEADVREAARAFTGWFVLRGQLRYLAREHDDAGKHILGREGNFAADDVVRILLEQPATSRLVVRKMYRWLISETDELAEALIAPLAESFARDYSVSQLVEKMLRSNLFFSRAAYRQKIKCPVEFAVGLVRALEAMVSTTNLAEDAAGLGQDLCHPPTVKGWMGGRHWINPATVAGRHNLSQSLLHGGQRYGDKADPWTVVRKHGCTTPQSAARFLLDLFVQGDVEPGIREALLANVPAVATNGDDGPKAALRDFAYAMTTLPEFHLA